MSLSTHLQMDSCSISFVGDFSANDGCYESWTRGRLANASRSVTKFLASQDVVLANLEGSLATDWIRNDKTQIGLGPDFAEILNHFNVSTVSLANNHSFDFGSSGLTATINSLRENNISWLGAGSDWNQASSGIDLDCKNVKVGVVAFTDRQCGAEHASISSPGVSLVDSDETENTIGELRRSCDFLVGMIHWGEERILMPSPRQRELARSLAEQGIDILIGTHAHVLQGYEQINDTHVFYSIGNFLIGNVKKAGKTVVRYCSPNFLNAIPSFRLIKGQKAELTRVRGVRSTGSQMKFVDPNRFLRIFKKRCDVLQAENYSEVFRRHQDFMWRYYIPIRYRLMLYPLRTLKGIEPRKIGRLIGLGRSPWRGKSG